MYGICPLTGEFSITADRMALRLWKSRLCSCRFHSGVDHPELVPVDRSKINPFTWPLHWTTIICRRYRCCHWIWANEVHRSSMSWIPGPGQSNQSSNTNIPFACSLAVWRLTPKWSATGKVWPTVWPALLRLVRWASYSSVGLFNCHPAPVFWVHRSQSPRACMERFEFVIADVVLLYFPPSHGQLIRTKSWWRLIWVVFFIIISLLFISLVLGWTWICRDINAICPRWLYIFIFGWSLAVSGGTVIIHHSEDRQVKPVQVSNGVFVISSVWALLGLLSMLWTVYDGCL